MDLIRQRMKFCTTTYDHVGEFGVEAGADEHGNPKVTIAFDGAADEHVVLKMLPGFAERLAENINRELARKKEEWDAQSAGLAKRFATV